eukprot:1158351-Pelagomonas_calceolata.AAC.4
MGDYTHLNRGTSQRGLHRKRCLARMLTEGLHREGGFTKRGASQRELKKGGRASSACRACAPHAPYVQHTHIP